MKKYVVKSVDVIGNIIVLKIEAVSSLAARMAFKAKYPDLIIKEIAEEGHTGKMVFGKIAMGIICCALLAASCQSNIQKAANPPISEPVSFVAIENRMMKDSTYTVETFSTDSMYQTVHTVAYEGMLIDFSKADYLNGHCLETITIYTNRHADLAPFMAYADNVKDVYRLTHYGRWELTIFSNNPTYYELRQEIID